MKNANKVLAVAVIGTSILSLQSCKKYEDGPMFSLRSKTARLTGEWMLTGGDEYDADLDFMVEFDKDGNVDIKVSGTYSYYSYYTYTYISIPYSLTLSGDWEWLDGKDGVNVQVEYGTGYYSYDIDTDWEITRLTNKELNVTDDYNYDWEFEKE